MTAVVKNFEDLLAWQRAMDLAVRVEAVCFCEELKRDFALRDQVRSAAQSIHANIAEGYERGSRGEFHHCLGIAKASCGELRSHLEFVRRTRKIEESVLNELFCETVRVGQIIGRLRAVVGQQRNNDRVPRAARRVPKV